MIQCKIEQMPFTSVEELDYFTHLFHQNGIYNLKYVVEVVKVFKGNKDHLAQHLRIMIFNKLNNR